MAEGRSNQAFCERLYLSPKTVETLSETSSPSWDCCPSRTTIVGSPCSRTSVPELWVLVSPHPYSGTIRGMDAR